MVTVQDIIEMYRIAGKKVKMPGDIDPYLLEEVEVVNGDVTDWKRFGLGYSRHLCLSNVSGTTYGCLSIYIRR